jgi:hypothetical protein
LTEKGSKSLAKEEAVSMKTDKADIKEFDPRARGWNVGYMAKLPLEEDGLE